MKTNIYYSHSKIALILLICFLVTGFLLTFRILKGEADVRLVEQIITWVGILFFGGCGLLILAKYIFSFVFNRPPMVIDDDRVGFYKLKGYDYVMFEDVERFELSKNYISVHLKDTALSRLRGQVSMVKFSVMRLRHRLLGYDLSLPADSFTLKPQMIYERLNEGLQAYNCSKISEG